MASVFEEGLKSCPDDFYREIITQEKILNFNTFNFAIEVDLHENIMTDDICFTI